RLDGCAADPNCHAAYPALETDFPKLVAEWNARPYEADVKDSRTGQTRHLAVTGYDVVAGLWNAMYDSSLIPVLPSLIAPLRARSDIAKVAVQQLADAGIDQLTGAAEGI